MKFALIGYGKMGKTIEALGLKQGHTFPLIIDINNLDDLNPEKVEDIDVAIEFSAPSAATENILKCLKLGIPVVSGTTGWNKRFREIENQCKEKNGAIFYASNFSIGINILSAMNRKLARIMDKHPEYEVSMEEVHHVHKLDAPSGTAITLAEEIIEESGTIKNWSLEENDDSSVMHISAIRKGEVKGRHTIMYKSDLDTITLAHDALTRDAFASGVLLAAEYIRDKKGVKGMADLLKI